MSKIWNSLKALERSNGGFSGKEVDSTPDRRCGPRVWAYAPILVYGRITTNEPFHEPTEALRVNARGGLLTLTTAVSPGQSILLINRLNKEQKCRLVGYRGTYLGRSAIGFEFLQPASDVWGAKSA